MELKNYVVKWLIDIAAKNPEVAAQTALDIQRDPESTATVFEVWENGFLIRTIDLGKPGTKPLPQT